MRKSIKKIIPRFIFRLDEYLIANKPLLWCSRIHFYIYFEILILLFTILLTSFQSITYTNVPDTRKILIYSAIINLLALIIWIINQDLFKTKIYYGIKIKFHNLKVTFFFLFVFILTASCIYIPFYYFNERAYNKLVDYTIFQNNSPAKHSNFSIVIRIRKYNQILNKLQPLFDSESLNSSATDSTVVADSTKMVDSAKMVDTTAITKTRDSILDQYRATIKRLNQNDIKNLSIILENDTVIDRLDIIRRLTFSKSNPQYFMVNIRDLSLDDDDYYRQVFNSYPVKVYYQNPIKKDSIYSDKFKMEVFVVSFKAQIMNKSAILKDTSIKRFYYFSKISFPRYSGQLVSCDSSSIENKLVANRAMQDYNNKVKFNVLPKDEYLYQVYMSQRGFETINSTQDDYVGIMLIVYFAATILALVSLFFYTVIRFFNIKNFAYSLILPILFIGVLISLSYLHQMPRHLDLAFFCSALILAIIFFFVTRFSVITLNILVFCFISLTLYLIYFLPQFSPFDILLLFKSQYRTGSRIIILTSAPAIIIILQFFLYKLQKLYFTPQ